MIDQDTDKLSEGNGSIVIDSRLAESGCLYIAIAGQRSDGHHFLEDVAAAGASLVIVERLTKPAPRGSYVQVRSDT